jgi:hypothetical protein
MSEINNLSAKQLRKAANLKDKIAGLEKELTKLLGSAPVLANPRESKPARKKRRMSAAGRARIAAAQKARWAKVKAGKK